MVNADIREAHKLLDSLFDNSELSHEQIDLIRGFVPELPTQMTLEALRQDVYDVWAGTHGNEWPDDMYCGLETWLSELHSQLQGLKDAPAAVPALPAGMRLADHEEYGRVVVSPEVGIDRCHEIFYLDPGMSSGTDISEVEPDSLTFIDAEPAKPAHPEFLETEADYENAPEGTIVVSDGGVPCHKFQSKWSSVAFLAMKDDRGMSRARRRVLRWGNE